jgi:pectate lyase
MRADRVAQAYVENNIFEAAENKRASHTKPAGKGKNDAGTLQDERPGFLQLVGNLKLNGAKLQPNEGEKVFIPSSIYSYQPEPASGALAKKIAARAGWQPAEFYGPRDAGGK